MKSSRCRAVPLFAGTLSLSLLPIFLHPASAQAPAAAGGTAPAAGSPGSSAPASSGPAPGVAGGTPKAAPNRPLTLSDVVRIAVGDNSGLVIAQQRLQKAQELIVQVNAQGRPQFSADAVDTYSTYKSFAPTLSNPVVTNPTLPGGGQIPSVVDAGTGFSTAFIGGGGGGNAPSSGSSSPVSLGASPFSGSGGTGTTAQGTGAGGTGANGVTTPGANAPGSLGTQPSSAPSTAAPAASPSTAAPAASPTAAPGAAAPATATPGAPAAPAPSTSAPSTSAPGTVAPSTSAPAAGAGVGEVMPSILAAYAAAPLSDFPASTSPAPASRSLQADEASSEKPRDTTTGTGGGTAPTSTTTTGAGGAQGKPNDAAARVSVSQYLDLFGLLSAARGAQDDVRDFYSLDIERLRNETALAAKNLFFNLLLTQNQVATQAEQVRYAQENVRITQERLKQGIVSRFDVLTAQTALSTAQQLLISAEDGRDLAQANLSYLLGTDPDLPLTLQNPPLPPLTQAVDLKQSTRTALTHRPEIRQAGSNIQEAQRLVRLAGSTLLPTVSIVASGEQTTTASVTAPRSYATLSAQIAVPLDDGGATRSRERSARVDVQTQTLTLEQLKLNVALEVRQATLNIRNAQAQAGAAQTGVTQAQEAVRLAYLRYQGGLGTFLDVLNALAQLAATRNNLSSAEFFYQISLAQLVRALGGR